MRVLVTGGSGTMGKALRVHFPNALFLSHHELDVTKQEDVWKKVWDANPDVIIHAAAITDHQCPDIGKLIATNVIGTENVARACTYAKLVYLSTHYVYPGEKGNYRETDECRPIGNYAWTKRAAECRVASVPNHLIVRGSWYDYETRLKYWEGHGALVDAWCSRERVEDAAAKIAYLINIGCWGTYNIGGPKRTFAQIMDDEGIAADPIRRSQLNIPYDFPEDCSVNTTKFDSLVG